MSMARLILWNENERNIFGKKCGHLSPKLFFFFLIQIVLINYAARERRQKCL